MKRADGQGDPLKPLRDIGSIEELRAAAEGRVALAQPLAANAHVHLPPNFSTFASVDEVVDLAAAEGVGVLGAGNYYDFSVYRPFAARCAARGIFPLFGLEIIVRRDDLAAANVRVNDPANPGKMYLCGKGITRFDPPTAAARRILNRIRRNDEKRMAAMVKKLADCFAAGGVETKLSAAAIVDAVATRCGCKREVVTLQERHLGQAFQEALFTAVPPEKRAAALSKILGQAAEADNAVAVQNAIRTHLMKIGRPAFVDETYIDIDAAIRLVLELGGIPCYPTLADGARPICQYEQPVEKLIADLQARGVTLAEFIPLRNAPDVLRRYVPAMREAGLAVVAGTEHNTPDRPPLTPACRGGQAIGHDVAAVLWEGACVVAAHQFLTACGACGFVDAEGRPNPCEKDADRRIHRFAALGAAVIQRYRQVRLAGRRARMPGEQAQGAAKDAS